jgi:hypothetical protein
MTALAIVNLPEYNIQYNTIYCIGINHNYNSSQHIDIHNIIESAAIRLRLHNIFTERKCVYTICTILDIYTYHICTTNNC